MQSTELVPGDIFELPDDGLALPCDLLLLNGAAIVNEAMLTGESTPIIKTSIPLTNKIFDIKTHYKFILFAGTKLIQKRAPTNDKVYGVVLSTAFNTQKGNIIRTILHPKELEFKFKKDSLRYILCMLIVCVIGFFATLSMLIKNGLTVWLIIQKGLDLVTTTVPPALPACLGIGISFAIRRLKRYGITCINRERVNIAGKVNVICFDKTGTLTEDYLDVYGYRPTSLDIYSVIFGEFSSDLTDSVQKDYEFYSNSYKMKQLNTQESRKQQMNSLFIEAVAFCHSLTRVNGKLAWDPIDVEMFESSKWLFTEQDDESCKNNNKKKTTTNTFVKPP